jgi:DNA-binding Lrp family transcriptional regulator
MIDDVDLRILAELQKNADRPQKVLADDLNLAESTLSKKIKKLRNDGVILRYMADIDYAKIGFLFSAITMIKEKKQADSGKTADPILTMPEAIHVYKVTGDWDFAVLWLCRTPEDLDRVVTAVHNHENIDRVQTTFLMRALKRQPGVRLDSGVDEAPTGGQRPPSDGRR